MKLKIKHIFYIALIAVIAFAHKGFASKTESVSDGDAIIAEDMSHSETKQLQQGELKMAENNDSVWDKTKDVSGDVWDKTKEVSSDTWEATKDVSGDVWDKTKEVSSDTWEATKDLVSDDDAKAAAHTQAHSETHSGKTGAGVGTGIAE